MKKKSHTCRIYSRNRINIIKPTVRLKLNKKKITIILIIIIELIVFFNIYKAILPIFETLCRDEATSLATKITNEQTTIMMANYSYDDLFTIEKDDSRKYTNDKCKYFKNR